MQLISIVMRNVLTTDNSLFWLGKLVLSMVKLVQSNILTDILIFLDHIIPKQIGGRLYDIIVSRCRRNVAVQIANRVKWSSHFSARYAILLHDQKTVSSEWYY